MHFDISSTNTVNKMYLYEKKSVCIYEIYCTLGISNNLKILTGRLVRTKKKNYFVTRTTSMYDKQSINCRLFNYLEKTYC